MPFPFPGETITPQAFGAPPEVPSDSATVTGGTPPAPPARRAAPRAM